MNQVWFSRLHHQKWIFEGTKDEFLNETNELFFRKRKKNSPQDILAKDQSTLRALKYSHHWECYFTTTETSNWMLNILLSVLVIIKFTSLVNIPKSTPQSFIRESSTQTWVKTLTVFHNNFDREGNPFEYTLDRKWPPFNASWTVWHTSSLISNLSFNFP